MDASTFQYPPDLMHTLIETIPRLCKSKVDLLLFFTGAGVPETLLQDLRDKVNTDKSSISKAAITREILARLNADGDRYLKQRREIIKRVTEFEDFSACWPSEQLEAKGLVAQVQQLVNVKDSFTRMNIEREREKQKHISDQTSKLAILQQILNEREAIKKELYSLFSEPNSQKRGKALESVLNRLFKFSGISIREAFTVVGPTNEGIVEQIDGAIELDGEIYLVEMKWWEKPVGRSDIAPHIVKVYSRAGARGIFISASGYTEPAVDVSREALQQRVFILCKLEEIVKLIDQERDLSEFLRQKIHIAVTEKNPLHEIV